MPATVTANIASHLAVMAERQPDAPAVHAPRRDSSGHLHYDQLTFRELNELSDTLACGFGRIGIRAGVRTALMVPPSLEFFALTFALFKVGAVPVLIDPGIGLKNFGNCLAEAEPAAFIGIPKAHAARVILGWARHTISISVTVGAKWFWGGYTADQVRQLGSGPDSHSLANTPPESTAAVLFTSGSTGPPKGVIYTHAAFSAQVEQVRNLYGIQPGEIDLPTFPLFALFGPALGMTEVLPEMDFTRPALADPAKIVDAIERFRVTNMFGSPALLNRLGRHGETHAIKLPTLRRALSAGAPVPAKVLARFAAMLPTGAQVFTPYGATECLPVASMGSNDILQETRAQTDLGRGVCVGHPVPGLILKIIRITDDPIAAWDDSLELPPGEIGEITVSAAQASRAYFNLPRATALAKIPNPERGQSYPPVHPSPSPRSADNPVRSYTHHLHPRERGQSCPPYTSTRTSNPERGQSCPLPAASPRTERDLIVPPAAQDSRFFHRMGDLGYLDERGRVWFCGRKSHRVVTRAGTLFTIPCEAIFNTHPAVFRSALVGVPRADDTEPVLCVELETAARSRDRATLRDELLALGARFPHTRAIRRILFHPSFPVDIRHNAKIFREKLARWAADRRS